MENLATYNPKEVKHILQLIYNPKREILQPKFIINGGRQIIQRCSNSTI
jgi:hypothetical protein